MPYQRIWLLIALSVLLVVALVGIHRPVWGDERHFVETIRLFGASPWPDSLRDYPEVSTPLFYSLYALWGRLVGFELTALRVLSLLIALATFILLFSFVHEFVGNRRFAFFVCVSLLINPYLIGLSLFVFPDMLTLLFLLAAVLFFARSAHGLAAGAVGAAMLCRQYAVFVLIAMWVTAGVMAYQKNQWWILFRFSLFALLSLVPLLLLISVWGGIAPPSGMRIWVQQAPIYWNPHAFVAYVAFSALYFLPTLSLGLKDLVRLRRLAPAALLLGGIVFLFQIEASSATLSYKQYDTVGLLHRAIVDLAGHGIVASLILYLATSMGFWVLLVILRQDAAMLKSGRVESAMLLSLCFYTFLLIMPLSYQIWEKYLVLVSSLLAVRWASSHVPAGSGSLVLTMCAGVFMLCQIA